MFESTKETEENVPDSLIIFKFLDSLRLIRRSKAVEIAGSST